MRALTLVFRYLQPNRLAFICHFYLHLISEYINVHKILFATRITIPQSVCHYTCILLIKRNWFKDTWLPVVIQCKKQKLSLRIEYPSVFPYKFLKSNLEIYTKI